MYPTKHTLGNFLTTPLPTAAIGYRRRDGAKETNRWSDARVFANTATILAALSPHPPSLLFYMLLLCVVLSIAEMSPSQASPPAKVSLRKFHIVVPKNMGALSKSVEGQAPKKATRPFADTTLSSCYMIRDLGQEVPRSLSRTFKDNKGKSATIMFRYHRQPGTCDVPRVPALKNRRQKSYHSARKHKDRLVFILIPQQSINFHP